MFRRLIGGCILALILFGAGVFVTYEYFHAQGHSVTTKLTPNTPLPIHVDTSPISDPGAIAQAAARVEPSVVTINTEYRPRYGAGDLFDFLGPQVIPRGAGSGVILTPDGTIVTNNHVVEDATKISVTLQNGRELEGRVLGTDSDSDLAVVKVDEQNLPAATLADSDKIKVGEWVVAVGNPLGLGTTVTAGIVSAIRKGNSLPGPGSSLTSVIQTDAAINPGNSGGALADIEGRVIGINSAIISTNGANIGIGLAIPINTVREVVGQLIAQGHVVRPWLGIAYGPITPRARDALHIPEDVNGAIVANVLQGSPADEAGLQPGDVIRAANNTPIQKEEDLQAVIQGLKVGDKLSLRIWRAGSEQTLTATLRERPAMPPASPG
ncbi:MAG TPA: trypsin-like peptidase domain-containing protein [Chthonomonadaceae bacterium]|nr:trypsin-like peptidase domain-containing protein [Chthonomonadaceae bacterium]